MKITTVYRSEPAGYEAEDHSANDEDDTVNETTGGRWRWCRAWPQRAGVLAVTAGIVLLVAACGGGSSSSGPSSSTSASSSMAASSSTGGSSNAGGSTLGQQDLAFSQCMRSDGVTDFPDPGSNGQFGKISAQLEDSPHFGTGFNACKHLLPDGGVSKVQQDFSQLLKFAQCMHAHGVPTYPEPVVEPYSSLVGGSVDELKVAGVNPNSPVVSAAVQACERANPVGS